MVSTEWQSRSRSPSRRSHHYDEGKSPPAHEDASLDGSAQPGDAREVAKRVLQDLEGLCVGPEEEGEESGSDLDDSDGSFESDSEWGSESQTSSSRSHGRRTGGMTLEELAVALNAAIEYHRPMNKVITKAAVDRAQNDSIERQFESASDSNRRASDRRQKIKTKETSRPETEEALFTHFQQILENKERLFYSMQAEPPVVENKEPSEHNSALVEEYRVSTDQQQQTIACVRDQATETEIFPQVLVPTAPFPVMEFRSLPDSPLLSLNDRHQHVQDHFVGLDSVGPTLADLVYTCRRNGSRPSASSSSSGSRSSASSSRSSGSVAKSSLASSFSQSFSSRSSGQDSHNSRSRGSQGSSSSRSSRHGKGSIRQEQQHSSGCKRGETARAADPAELQPAISAPIGEMQPEGHDRPGIPLPSLTPQNDIEAPAFVKWELDLSNFTS